MDGCIVEGALSVSDAEETGALGEGGRSQTGHLEEGAAASEGAVFISVGHDISCHSGADACDMGKKGWAGGIEIHAYVVDGVLNDRVQ